nr:immunoglobulin light chain junction region [Macaca mulatta]MOW41171.1 immunoglobulin light chain junction region [Macaca mulatta]
CQQNSNWPRTF